MGASKTDYFTPAQNELAGLLKALAHPARIAIVEHLLQTPGCICTDIVRELPLAQPTISQHLRELKTAGLIQGEVEGNAICYCLNPQTATQLQQLLAALFATPATPTPCC